MADAKVTISGEDNSGPAFKSAENNAKSAFDSIKNAGGQTTDLLKSAWDQLGIKSAADIEASKNKINSAYEAIKNSNTATQADIVRAETARAQAIAAIDRDNFAERKTMLDTFKENWVQITASLTAAWAASAWMRESMHMALEAEEAWSKLRIQVEGLGVAYDSVGPRIEEVVKASARYAHEMDDDVAKTLQQLVFASGNLDGSMKNLNLTYDLAYQKGVDAGTAANLLGKAMSGNVEMLGRVVPELRNLEKVLGTNATEAQKTAYMWSVLESKASGASDKMTEHLKRVKDAEVAWKHFRETMGDMGWVAMDSITGQGIKSDISGLADVLTNLTNVFLYGSAAAEQMANGHKNVSDAAAGNSAAHKQTTKDLAATTKAINDEALALEKLSPLLAKSQSSDVTAQTSKSLRQLDLQHKQELVSDQTYYNQREAIIESAYSRQWDIESAEYDRILGVQSKLNKAKEYPKWLELEGQLIEKNMVLKNLNNDREASLFENESKRIDELTKKYQGYATAIKSVGDAALKFAGENFAAGMDKQKDSIDGMKTVMTAYIAVIDEVTTAQIKMQQAIEKAMKNTPGMDASAIRAQSIIVLEAEKTQAEDQLKAWQAYYNELKTLYTAFVNDEKAKRKELADLEKQLQTQSLQDQIDATELDKNQASERLAAWTSYYSTLTSDYSAAIDKQKAKAQELLDLEEKIARQRMDAAQLVTSLQNAVRDESLTPIQKYYAHQKDLNDEYNAAMLLSGQSRIDALIKYQKDAAAEAKVVTHTDSSGNTVTDLSLSTATATALKQISDAQAKIVVDQDALAAKTKAELATATSAVNQLAGTMAFAQANIVVYGNQVVALGNSLKALKMEVDSTTAQKSITDRIKDVQDWIDKNEEWKQKLETNMTDAGKAIDALKGVVVELETKITSLKLVIDTTGATAAISDVKSIIDNYHPVTYWKIVQTVGGSTGETSQDTQTYNSSGFVSSSDSLGFASGTSYVPSTGYYQLHRGETVQNRTEVSRSQKTSVTINMPPITINAQGNEDPEALAARIVRPLKRKLQELAFVS